jgi:hypothetical protein
MILEEMLTSSSSASDFSKNTLTSSSSASDFSKNTTIKEVMQEMDTNDRL